MDFDDLITLATSLLENDPGFLPFTFWFIDEFQDTSPDQIALIKNLNRDKLFVIGDDWQSIYKFRGADVSLSLNFYREFPESKTMFLTKNFRSQKRIVQLGNQAIRLSNLYIPKKLGAIHNAGTRPRCFIINGAMDTLKGWRIYHNRVYNKTMKVYPDKHLTILVRTNHIRHQLEKIVPENCKVLTIHSAKGLEFDNLLVFGVSQDLIPHKWGDPDEEVRLFYVAITRAKTNLEFLAFDNNGKFSIYLPFLARECSISYLD